MLESLFNKLICFQACNFNKKRLQHRRFPVNIANFMNTYFEKHLRTAGSDSSNLLHIAKLFRKRIGLPDWPLNIKSLYFTYFHPYSFVLSLVVTHCNFFYSLSFDITCCTIPCNSLSLVASLVVSRCTTRGHSLSLVVIRCTTCYHSLSLVVIRCHSIYHSSVFL